MKKLYILPLLILSINSEVYGSDYSKLSNILDGSNRVHPAPPLNPPQETSDDESTRAAITEPFIFNKLLLDSSIDPHSFEGVSADDVMYLRIGAALQRQDQDRQNRYANNPDTISSYCGACCIRENKFDNYKCCLATNKTCCDKNRYALSCNPIECCEDSCFMCDE